MNPLDEKPLVEMRGISKAFATVRANAGIDFDVRSGEVHTLLGENGAGKSTLMNILNGLYIPDSGTIRVKGEVHRFSSPRDAIAAGIGMVHQHFMLVPVLTVWENMVMGLPGLEALLPKRAIVERIRDLSSRYGLQVEPEARVWQLSVGEQQRVEILKMLYRRAEILVLDEPTSVLTPQEVQHLFNTIRQMTAEGHGVVFISHKLDEVMEISDRVTILRKGEVVETLSGRNVSREELAEKMVGRKVVFAVDKAVLNAGETVLEADGICALNDRGLPAVRNLSLSIREGEILGIAGIAGNGQRELCEALCGLRHVQFGSVILKGIDMTGAHPMKFIQAGVGYIPADRKGTGLVGSMNLRENFNLKNFWRKPYSRGVFLSWENVAGETGRIVERFGVSTPGLGVPVRNLSGGNQQRLMLGRELSGTPSLIVAMQPTWGLDVGATEFVREQLLKQRERGSAILLVSEDLEEVMAMSDRLAVIHKGEIMGIVEDPREVTEEDLGLMMAGVRIEEAVGRRGNG
jgi:simple sugar transport system ATP-binding protein